ncbi:hypothetical protein [Phaeobacter sp. BS52]|uniref:hypothetical protein n=1 Tax=Phaeobacter sp. BS52 TaxID=2907241 RepID=UPI003703C7B7
MTAISYQLYGSRNWPLADTLTMLAEAGYTDVEGYGALFAQVPTLAGDLRAAGLSMPTLHYGLDDLERDPQAAIAIGRAVGAEAIFAPMLQAPDRPVDPARLGGVCRPSGGRRATGAGGRICLWLAQP